MSSLTLLERLVPQDTEFKANTHFLSLPMASMVVDKKSLYFGSWSRMVDDDFLGSFSRYFLWAVSIHVSTGFVLFDFNQFFNMHIHAVSPLFFVVLFSLTLQYFVWILKGFFFSFFFFLFWFSFIVFLLGSYSSKYTISIFHVSLSYRPTRIISSPQEKHIARYGAVRWVLDFFTRISRFFALPILITKNDIAKNCSYT